MDENSRAALLRRRGAGLLAWRGPAGMLFARSALGVVAQGAVAGIFALRGSATPWRDSEPWLPVYGTLIDVGCLALLWPLTRREGIRLLDLVGFERSRFGRDVLLGLAIVPPALVFIFGGVYVASWLVYGSVSQPYIFGPLPLPAALYGVLVWPFLWGVAEQMTYNGYLVPRLQVLTGSTAAAVAVVAVPWAAQHAFMPLTFDGEFMAYRTLAAIPYSVFGIVLYLRLRRLIPLAVAHTVMDGASVLIGLLASLRGGG